MTMHDSLLRDDDSRDRRGRSALELDPVVPIDRLDREVSVEFDDYLDALWRARWPIAVVLGAAMAVAIVYSLLQPRLYEASSTVSIAQSKIGVGEQGPPIQVATYRPLFENRALAIKLIDEFNLDAPPHQLTASTFLSRALSVDEIRGTSLARVRVTLRDPQLAAAVATRLTLEAVAQSRRINSDEAVQVRNVLKDQLDEAKSRLDMAQQKLHDYRRTAQVELLRKDVDALLDGRGRLLTLQVDIEAERARLERAERELAARDPVDTLTRSIDSTPPLLEAARSQGAAPSDVLGLQLKSESANPVFQELDAEVAMSRATLAGLERERRQLLGNQRSETDQRATMALLYEREAELKRLELERDLAEKLYVEVANRYEGARLQVAGRSAQLQIIDEALPPDQPRSRGTVRNAAIAAVLAFALCVTVIVATRARAGRTGRPAAVR
jgi:uncharacterized protein involved in exopolysaccharide biosynthesis